MGKIIMKNNRLQKTTPPNWQQLKLAEIFEFKNGLNKEKKYFGKGTPIINYVDVYKGGGLFQESINGLVEVTESERDRFEVKKGDVFFTRTSETLNEIGFSAVALGEFKYTVFSGFVLRARPKNNLLSPNYAKYCFKTQRARQEIKEKSSYTTRALTSVSSLNHVNIFLPSITEQNRIVTVLETWDKAIEKLSKKIEIKKQIRNGLMQILLTSKKRLGGFSDKWNTVVLDDVADFINGFAFKSSTYVDRGRYKVVTIANVQDGYMHIEEPKYIDELPSKILKDQILEKRDILISMTGNVGRVCEVNQDNCLLNQRVGKIVPKNIDRDLLLLILLSRNFLNKMIDSAQGGAQGNLSTTDIKEYTFDIPKTKEEQCAISKKIITADEEINKFNIKLSLLKDQKKYLLNNLITGKIRTPEICQ